MKRYRRNADDIKHRIEEWRKLSLQQQLDKLDERLGIQVGATKQRQRILEKLAKGK